jgi:hypothetical protein
MPPTFAAASSRNENLTGGAGLYPLREIDMAPDDPVLHPLGADVACDDLPSVKSDSFPVPKSSARICFVDRSHSQLHLDSATYRTLRVILPSTGAEETQVASPIYCSIVPPYFDDGDHVER